MTTTLHTDHLLAAHHVDATARHRHAAERRLARGLRRASRRRAREDARRETGLRDAQGTLRPSPVAAS